MPMRGPVLIIAVIIGPAVWGLLVSLVMGRIWPETPPVSPERDGSSRVTPTAPPFDYQI